MDLLRRMPCAEQLAQRASHAQAIPSRIDPRNEVLGREALQRRDAEMRVLRRELFQGSRPCW